MRPSFRDASWHDWIHRLPLEEVQRRQDVKRHAARIEGMERGLPSIGLLDPSERGALSRFLNDWADALEDLSIDTRRTLYALGGTAVLTAVGAVAWGTMIVIALPFAIVSGACTFGGIKVGIEASDLRALIGKVARILRRIARNVG